MYRRLSIGTVSRGGRLARQGKEDKVLIGMMYRRLSIGTVSRGGRLARQGKEDKVLIAP